MHKKDLKLHCNFKNPPTRSPPPSSRCREESRDQHLLECGLPAPACPTTGTLLLRLSMLWWDIRMRWAWTNVSGWRCVKFVRGARKICVLRVWLRWSSEWGGDRVEEGVPGTQKARRWSDRWTKKNVILLRFARFAHFLTHEKDLRANPKIMEDVERYHKDIQRYIFDCLFKIIRNWLKLCSSCHVQTPGC